jgi:hypothetical protein
MRLDLLAIHFLPTLRIVAEIHPQDLAEFWDASSKQKSEIMRAFAAAGVTAVVAEPRQSGPLPVGWETIGQTGYLLYKIR